MEQALRTLAIYAKFFGPSILFNDDKDFEITINKILHVKIFMCKLFEQY